MASEQLSLFGSGIDLAKLREKQEQVMAAKRAPNTRKVYRQSWNHFVAWCEQAGKTPLPATPDTVSLYVTHSLFEERRRIATVDVRLAAIATRHTAKGFASPTSDSNVRALLINARRELKEKPRGKKALTPEHLRKISQMLQVDGRPKAIRDRAIILMGFAVGWRRSELSALETSDISVRKDGLYIQLWKSKTDQEGKGLAVRVPYGQRKLTCPVGALKAWLEVRGRWKGPLFTQIKHAWGVQTVHRNGFAGEAIFHIVRQALERIGEDPELFGAHSLRAGMATAAAMAGSSEISIMNRAGWKNVATVAKYVRPAQAFKADPLKGVL